MKTTTRQVLQFFHGIRDEEVERFLIAQGMTEGDIPMIQQRGHVVYEGTTETRFLWDGEDVITFKHETLYDITVTRHYEGNEVIQRGITLH